MKATNDSRLKINVTPPMLAMQDTLRSRATLQSIGSSTVSASISLQSAKARSTFALSLLRACHLQLQHIVKRMTVLRSPEAEL